MRPTRPMVGVPARRGSAKMTERRALVRSSRVSTGTVAEFGASDMEVCSGRRESVPSLIEICRECFPESPRWRSAGRLAELWWACAIESPAVEVSILMNDGNVAGCAALVIDEDIWMKNRRARSGSLCDRAVLAIRNPGAALGRVQHAAGKLCRRMRRSPNVGRSKRARGQRAWLELIAVSPFFVGRGGGKFLLQNCEAQARAIGVDTLELRVGTGNHAAIRLYENGGYTVAAQEPRRILYAKALQGRAASTRPDAKIGGASVQP